MYHQLLILVTFILLPNSTAVPHFLLEANVILAMSVYAHMFLKSGQQIRLNSDFKLAGAAVFSCTAIYCSDSLIC